MEPLSSRPAAPHDCGVLTPSAPAAAACRAPEVVQQQTYSLAVDMWSLGVILYILLTWAGAQWGRGPG